MRSPCAHLMLSIDLRKIEGRRGILYKPNLTFVP